MNNAFEPTPRPDSGQATESGAASAALITLSDAELVETADLTGGEFDELENQLVLRAACMRWTGDPMRQPLKTMAAIVRGILLRRLAENQSAKVPSEPQSCWSVRLP